MLMALDAEDDEGVWRAAPRINLLSRVLTTSCPPQIMMSVLRRLFKPEESGKYVTFEDIAPEIKNKIENGGINEMDSRIEDVNELLQVEWETEEDVEQGLALITYVQQSLDLVKKKADEVKKAAQVIASDPKGRSFAGFFDWERHVLTVSWSRFQADKQAAEAEAADKSAEAGSAQLPPPDEEPANPGEAEEDEEDVSFMRRLAGSLDPQAAEELLEDLEECLPQPLRGMYWKVCTVTPPDLCPSRSSALTRFYQVRDAGKADAAKLAKDIADHVKGKRYLNALACLLSDKKGSRALDRMSGGGVRAVMRLLFEMQELHVGVDLAKDPLPSKAQKQVRKSFLFRLFPLCGHMRALCHFRCFIASIPIVRF